MCLGTGPRADADITARTRKGTGTETDTLAGTEMHTFLTSRCLLSAGLLAFVLCLASFTQSLWITGKALLAQQLLDRAWQASLASGTPVRPWAWADVRTVARLTVINTDETFIVLSDSSGEAMAFGPGLVAGNLSKASSSTIAIGGHRDTHLAFLEHAVPGDEFVLDTGQGSPLRYRLQETRIVDTRSQRVQIAGNSPGLVLITCYPFNAMQTGGPWRMIASAGEIH